MDKKVLKIILKIRKNKVGFYRGMQMDKKNEKLITLMKMSLL